MRNKFAPLGGMVSLLFLRYNILRGLEHMSPEESKMNIRRFDIDIFHTLAGPSWIRQKYIQSCNFRRQELENRILVVIQ